MTTTACRHGAAAAAAHAAALLRRVSLVPSYAAAASCRRHAMQRVVASGLGGSSAALPGAAGSTFAATVAASATVTRRCVQQQHPTRGAAGGGAGEGTSVRASAFSFPRYSALRRSAAALQSLCPPGAAAGVPCAHSSSLPSRTGVCCSGSRYLSSSSSRETAATPSSEAGGANPATGSRGEAQQQQEEEDPSGASRAPGSPGAARAAAVSATAAPAGARRPPAPSEAAAAASAQTEEEAAAACESKPHKPAAASESHQDGAADDAAAEDAYTALQEKYRVCLEEVEALRKKAETLQDKALRTLADMENARARHQKELARTKEYAASDFAKAMLEVADSMAYATKALRATLPQQQQHAFQQQQQQQTGGGPGTVSASSSSSNSTGLTVEQLQHIYEGVAMTESLLHRTLDRFGVQQFDPTGEVFDPAVHEALFEIDDPTKEKGRVAQVIQMGYKIKDRVLRAAKVGVARGGSGSSKAS